MRRRYLQNNRTRNRVLYGIDIDFTQFIKSCCGWNPGMEEHRCTARNPWSFAGLLLPHTATFKGGRMPLRCIIMN